ncbi:IS110 family transposase [Zunongwangia pacifica]|uniref:IS110 family transposase n=2 Tax=Zunongwangia pacifica TaxID=2911062 RepID=A0A9X2A5H5_9FLAO|nr:IS110 family transposase [Zunongwangia pacifica]MCL6221014.1 IS110 family transposase [Zunongwangia pacifica]
MEKSFTYVGIDISKLTFDVALLEKGKYQHYKFKNEVEGFQGFSALLSLDHCCVMEASGPYYLNLASFLFDKGIMVSVVNPLVIRRYSQMRLIRAKTDKKDATVIAEYGHCQQPGLWTKEEAYVLELKQMQAYSEQLTKSRGSFLRQKEAFEAHQVQSKLLMKKIDQQIKGLEKQLKVIEKEMVRLVETYHQEQFKQLQSIPGIGAKTAMTLIVLSGGFTKFTSAKQLSSYVGISPRIFESGTSVKGKARICKMGMSRIRAMLYVCSWSAKKKNKACRELFERLVEKGKAKKLALIAVVNKLLKQAFAIATQKTYYTENNLNLSCI